MGAGYGPGSQIPRQTVIVVQKVPAGRCSGAPAPGLSCLRLPDPARPGQNARTVGAPVQGDSLCRCGDQPPRMAGVPTARGSGAVSQANPGKESRVATAGLQLLAQLLKVR